MIALPHGFCLAIAAALLAGGVVAAPQQLTSQPELLAGGELKAKVLAQSQGVPPPTPQGNTYTFTRGSETKEVRLFNPADYWKARAYAGMWRDKKGNVMRLARVTSLVPTACVAPGAPGAEKEALEKELEELEKNFQPSEENLEKWKSCWGGAGFGKFITAKNDKTYYVEFVLKDSISKADETKLLRAFERSVSTMTALANSNNSSMKWWEDANSQYKFLTDLDKAKGGKFIKDAMRTMEALRESYEFYVPPKRKLALCSVRVFKTLAGYRDYRRSNGVNDTTSCGLWDPSREELLIVSEDPKEAQNIMRHEAFHQYLHFATGRGDHAMWFNEGHACFFENVKYNPAKNTVKVVEEGIRSAQVAKNPERYANAIASVLKKSHQEFYSGDQSLNYSTAWAIVYFLQKGAYTSDEFAPYRKVIPKYLELMEGGADSASATAQAWDLVKGRNVAADFLSFWKDKRKAASKVR